MNSNHILKHHHPEKVLFDGEVVSVFACGLCTHETVHKLVSLTSTRGEMLSHKPNGKYEFEYIYAIDLPIGWGLDGTVAEYVFSWVQTEGPKSKGIEDQEYPLCHQLWPLRLI